MQKTLKALVLLDIVESTKFIERYGSLRASKVFFSHDKLVRTLIYKYEGTEIDKTDGFLIIFDRCIDGVNFAMAYHSTIPKRTGLKARIGIHWGEVVMKYNDLKYVEKGAKRIEVEGMAKPVAARIMSLARGGQTLLSHKARRASELRKNFFTPKDLRYKCLGKYSLKGVTKPMTVHAVGIYDSDFELPIENDKVKRVSRPSLKQKDYTLKDIIRFLVKISCICIIGFGLKNFLHVAWLDPDLVSEATGVDFTWFSEVKELYEILSKKVKNF